MGKFIVALLLVAVSQAASANVLAYTGTFADPNDAFLVEFTLSADTAINVQSWGYGGSGMSGIGSGTNGAGATIAAGGFDPYLSFFSGTGAGATFLGSNDDGSCPPGTEVGLFSSCFDSTFNIVLAAGDYTVAITQAVNMSFAENLGSGTLGDGFIRLRADFSDLVSGDPLTAAFAFDISTDADALTEIGTRVVSGNAVPVPPTLALLIIALAGLGATRMRPSSALRAETIKLGNGNRAGG